MWAAGDYAAVATPLLIVAELLCEAADLRAGWRVLDVATGSGNAALGAARRRCEVTGIDYVPSLLERARERAALERLEASFEEGDAEQLVFADAGFDAVLSTFGVMFAPDQERAARELVADAGPAAAALRRALRLQHIRPVHRADRGIGLTAGPAGAADQKPASRNEGNYSRRSGEIILKNNISKATGCSHSFRERRDGPH